MTARSQCDLNGAVWKTRVDLVRASEDTCRFNTFARTRETPSLVFSPETIRRFGVRASTPDIIRSTSGGHDSVEGVGSLFLSLSLSLSFSLSFTPSTSLLLSSSLSLALPRSWSLSLALPRSPSLFLSGGGRVKQGSGFSMGGHAREHGKGQQGRTRMHIVFESGLRSNRLPKSGRNAR